MESGHQVLLSRGQKIAAEAETRRFLGCIADDELCSLCIDQFISPEEMTTALCWSKRKQVLHSDCVGQVQNSQYF